MRRGILGCLLAASLATAYALGAHQPVHLILSGGWTLTLLPVHASAFKRRAERQGREAETSSREAETSCGSAAGGDQPPPDAHGGCSPSSSGP